MGAYGREGALVDWKQRTAFRSAHWAKPLSGQRADIMAWLREKERQFDSEVA